MPITRHDSSLIYGSRRACTTSTDSRSQRNRASRRGGHVTTRARSSWIGRPAAVSCSRRPDPGLNILPLSWQKSHPESGVENSIPFNNAAERALRAWRYRADAIGPLPVRTRAARGAAHVYYADRNLQAQRRRSAGLAGPCAGEIAGSPARRGWRALAVELEIQPEARNRRRRSLSAAARAIPRRTPDGYAL